MKPYQLIFIAVYMPVVVMYLFSETSGDFKRRAVNKIALASMFMLYALVELFRRDPRTPFDYLLMIAIIFSFLGDVFLLWDFVKGGVLFMIGNFLYIAYFLLRIIGNGITAGNIVCIVALAAVPIGMFMYWCSTGFVKLGKLQIFKLYVGSITVAAACGLVLMYTLKSMRGNLMGIGILLFMISDYWLSLHKFRDKESKFYLRSNSFSYFTGMMLIALSMGML